MFCRVELLVAILFALQCFKPAWCLETINLGLTSFVPEQIEDSLESLQYELRQLKRNSLYHPQWQIARKTRILRRYDEYTFWLKKNIIRIVEREYPKDLSQLAQDAIEVSEHASKTLKRLTEGPQKSIERLKDSIQQMSRDRSLSLDRIEKNSHQIDLLSTECEKFVDDLQVAAKVIAKLRDWTKIEITTGYISRYPLVPWDPMEYLRVYANRRMSNMWWKKWWNKWLLFEENNAHTANSQLNQKHQGTEEEKLNKEAIAIASDPVTIKVYMAHTLMVAFDTAIKEGLRRNSVAYDSVEMLRKPFAPMVYYTSHVRKSVFHETITSVAEEKVLRLMKRCLDGQGKHRGFGISETVARALGSP